MAALYCHPATRGHRGPIQGPGNNLAVPTRFAVSIPSGSTDDLVEVVFENQVVLPETSEHAVSYGGLWKGFLETRS